MCEIPGEDEVSVRVRQTIAERKLFKAAAPLVLMVSGGSDSVALARLLAPLQQHQCVVVLHINHQLRQDAIDDETFVRKLCAELGLECVVERVDVAACAQAWNDDLEQAGRKVRYKRAEGLLDEICLAAGLPAQAGRIATAHTMDDRAETLLMRVIVGGGSASLASIPYKRGRIVRPLLDCRKQQLRCWLHAQAGAAQGASEQSNVAQGASIEQPNAAQKHGALPAEYASVPGKQAGPHQSPTKNKSSKLWCEDTSNASLEQFRGFVRHSLLPLLAQRNPNIVATLCRNAEVFSAESDYLTKAAQELLPLTSASFAAPLALVRRAVYLAVNDAMQKLAPNARITFEHIDLIVAKGAKPGFGWHLPGGIEVRNVKGKLCFFPAKPPLHDPRNQDRAQPK
ncbi:MAG: tRNA lysidine(34) synthetase TilS [Coriobacteriales bacterium]|nr:tRNA lysidine(34) synthetase TilS [Coriobacteriales bacterium]